MVFSSFRKSIVTQLVPMVLIGVTIFSYASAENLMSPEEIVREQLLASVDSLSGVTNSGIETSLVGQTQDVAVSGILSSSGSSASGMTQSGATGATLTPIDYSNYLYYDGVFMENGIIYGNTFHPKSLKLNPPSFVKIYSYDEYKNIPKNITPSNKKTSSSVVQSRSMSALAVGGTLRDGLIGEYLLNGTLKDTSGYGRDSTGTVDYGDSYNNQLSAIFRQSAKYYTAIDNYVGAGTGGVTFSAWVKYNSLPTAGYGPGVVVTGGGNNPFVIYSLAYTNYPSGTYHLDWFREKNKVGNSFYISYNTNFTTGTWYHIVGTSTPTSSALYLNGTLVGTGVSDTGIGSIGTDSDPNFLLGREFYRRDDNNSRYLDGSMQRVRIYNRALSASEIQDLYTELPPASSCTDGVQNQNETGIDFGGVCGTAIPRSGLIAEYLFNSTGADTSGNNNHGVANNVNWGNGPNGFNSAIFNGSSSSITNNSPVGLARSTGQEITVNAWIKWTGGTGYQDIATIRGASGHNWIFYKHTTGDKLSFHGGNNQFTGTYSLIPGQWIMATAMVDSGGVSKMFVNGSLVDTITGYNFGTTYNNIFTIGAGPSMNEFFSGAISNMRIYNRTLSAAELQGLYTETIVAVSNNTSSGYVSSYLSYNPTVTSSPYDNYSKNSNIEYLRHTSDEGIIATMLNALGDPVNLATGEFAYDNTLMKIPGIGMAYELGITYKNQASYNGPLGFNWDHGYNQYLSVEGNGNVLYANGKLGTFRFIKNGSIFVRNEGLRATLVQSGSLYTINYDNGNKATFNSINRISSLIDTNNNTLNFTYSGGYLSGVVDTLGRTINYSYYDHNRLKSVVDFSGRRADFTYYTGATASGNLYDLRDITLTNSGTTKKISFEYSSGSSEPQIHNITKLIDAKGQIYVENTYDNGDRVATQKYGDGILIYTYTLSGSVITQNTVLDKLGNRSDYIYDATGNYTSIRYYNQAQTGSVIYGYTYSASGFLLSETRPRGNGYKYGYDGSGNLLEKRQKANMSLADSASDIVNSYTYNSRNEKLTDTLPNGAQVIYTRDGSGNILTKTQSGSIDYNGGVIPGMTTNYAYYSGGLQKSVLTPIGRLTQYYYSSGQLFKVVTHTGISMSTGTLNYGTYGTLSSSTDGDNYTTNFIYTPFDLVSTKTTSLGIVTAYNYDNNNNKIRETVYLTGGLQKNTYFYYDSLDHLTGSLMDTSTGQSVLTSYKYDANGNIIEKKIGNGALTKYKYNEFAKIIEERIIMVPGDSTKDIVTSYNYDSNNNLVSKTDPRGYNTTYAYDLYDRLNQETNAQGAYTTYTYIKDGNVDSMSTYTSTGLILTKKSTLYDNYGHVTKSTRYLVPSTNTGAIEERYTYNGDFDPINVYYDPTNNSNRTMYIYDILSFNRVFTYDPLNDISNKTYNKRELISDEWYHASGQDDKVYAAYIYDGDGRMIQRNNTLGKYKTYIYDNLGFLTKLTDEVGRVTSMTRDYRGLMTSSTSYSGSTPITTNYTYDDRGNMTSITDPLGRTTSYQYDLINRNTKVIYPDLKEMVYTYDKNSNLLTKTDPNGTVVTNTYNSLNQLTNRSIVLAAGNLGGATSETYVYDALGRLTSGGDSLSGSLSFTYDALSRLKSETQKPLGGTGYTVGYNYSYLGDLTGITLPDGKLQTISYDLLHRPLVITYSGQTISTNTYTGRVQSGATYGNGLNTKYFYDILDRPTSINHGAGFPNPSYTYNDASDILSDGSKSYAYDSVARLTTATAVATATTNEAYSYDKNGNRISGTMYAGALNYAVNNLDQYTSFSGTMSIGSITYDNNGNLGIFGSRIHTYDYNNRLIQIDNFPSSSIKYKYDILGRRIQKIDDYGSPNNPTTTIYIYAGDNIISEYKTIGVATGSGGTGTLTPLTLQKNYINSIGTDALLAYDAEEQLTSTGLTKTTNRYYYHLNQLGSVVALSSSTGSILMRYSYDSFGYPRIVQGSGTGITMVDFRNYPGNKFSNLRLWTGREHDRETGYYYHRARYSFPELMGRFISRDPIGQNDQVNLYTYVANSPLKYVDRNGTDKKIIGTLRIYSWYDDYFDLTDEHLNPFSLGDGHSWIELTIGNEVTTYGIGAGWRGNNHAISKNSDITKNLERDRNGKNESNVVSLGLNINKSQLSKINDYINNGVKNGYTWEATSPCTDFTSNIWNMVSNIQLEDRALFGINNPYGLSTPDALAQSIAKTQIKKGEYESSGKSQNQENPYKNIIY